MKILRKSFQFLILVLFAASVTAVPVKLKVMVKNIAPSGGVTLTPVWVGFHDGSFDSYNRGDASSAAIEALAEDGNTNPISSDFLASGGNDGVVLGGGSPPLIFPGTTGQAMLMVDSSNRYFSYASMVLASSDYFIGNDDPLEHDITSLLDGTVNKISFFIGQPGSVNDAGTEINNFVTSAGNPVFFDFPAGQTAPDQGADQNGLIEVVNNAYEKFLNIPNGFNLSPVDFNQYNQGIAEVTITAVPLPAALPMSLAGLTMLFGMKNFRRKKTV